MHSFILILFASLGTSLASIWPNPTQLTSGTTVLKLSPAFKINLDVKNAPQDLVQAVQRTSEYLRNDKLEILTVDRGDSYAAAIKAAPALKSLTVSFVGNGKIQSISDEAVAPLESRVEGYQLTVPADGSDAVLKANSTLGLFRGLTTFTQLWFDLEEDVYTVEAPYSIVDSPKFPYRGFMLDTARNFYPVKDIKRTLDAMSWVKLSTLHWHVVDAEAFPLIVPGYEDVAEKGAYNRRAKYSAQDVQDIVSYAAARGIDVIAEIDTPGHTSIIHNSHPEHVACFEASPWTKFGSGPNPGQLRIASPATVNFTSGLLAAASTLFKSSYFCTGGDELNANCYASDQQTQDDLKAQGLDISGALNKFTASTHGALKAKGKTAMVWEDILTKHNVPIANDTLILVWIDVKNVATVAAKGYPIVHAATEYFYLDCGAGSMMGNDTSQAWCDFVTFQKTYKFDPYAGVNASHYHLVKGGQSLLWSEQSSPANLDPIAWPRTASTAEVMWSGPGGDLEKAMTRLHEVVYRFRQRGVNAISLQPEWCALRPGKCDLLA